ncbi:hypothetical protein FB451DRAFT_1403595 [Mycena latifolia]|nr:hypothetical protein FB451DRAFT_1403595 [Mycena latifolia]
MYLLIRRRSHATADGEKHHYAPFNSTMFISGCVLFIVITGVGGYTVDGGCLTSHRIGSSIVLRAFQGFIHFHDGQEANAFFLDFSQASLTVEDTFLALSLVIGDAVIVSADPWYCCVVLTDEFHIGSPPCLFRD